MNHYQKTALFICSIYSCFTTAGTIGGLCEGENVHVPCEARAWDFGAAALYLKPSVSNSGQPGAYVTTSPGRRHIISFNQDWGWGFKLDAGYHFLKGNDINLNWSHFNNSSSNQVTGAIAPNGLSWEALVKSSPTWNAVNLEWGQKMDLDPSRTLRFHGGLGYAQINTEVKSMRSGLILRERQSRYNGVGPRVGFDANYFLTPSWNMYAKAAGALFVGHEGFTDYINFASITYDLSSTSIVPEIEAKLGFQYDYALSTKNHLLFDLGWMFVNYFDAEVYEHPLGPNYIIKNANFGLQGLTLELKWKGSLA